jgi:hypothetical protein
MTLYTFYPCQPDGGSGTFEAFDLDADDQVPALARKMLAEHAHSVYVAVWEGDRLVATTYREPAARPEQALAGA